MGSEIKLQKIQNLNFSNFLGRPLWMTTQIIVRKGENWMAIKKSKNIYRERGLKENKKTVVGFFDYLGIDGGLYFQ